MDNVIEKTKNLIEVFEESDLIKNLDHYKKIVLDNQELLELINKYNNSTSYLKKENAVKNSVVSRINSIITSPVNEILATAPVDDSLDE